LRCQRPRKRIVFVVFDLDVEIINSGWTLEEFELIAYIAGAGQKSGLD